MSTVPDTPTQSIIDESIDAVKQIYAQSEEQSLFYHNWRHTELVLQTVKEIADNTDGIADSEKEALELAAIFHDVAYTRGSKDHEKEGAAYAAKFLSERSFPAEQIALIERLILATCMENEPQDLLEEIMRDSDLSHLAKKDYMNTSYKDLYQEIKSMKEQSMTPGEWANMCVDFIDNHQYYTEYARQHFEAGKQENMKEIKALVSADLEKHKKKKKDKKDKVKAKKKKEEQEIPVKGIETMFRVSLRNHVQLSQIADNKANTLISVNAIIISIVLSTLFPKLDNNAYLIYPGMTLLTFSILTVIISILSTIPKTSHGSMSREEVGQKRGNLLFFGNFHNMPITDYEWGVETLMEDKDYLYKTLTRDLYYLGRVLHRKYVLLRYSYFLFVTGLTISIIIFIISVLGL